MPAIAQPRKRVFERELAQTIEHALQIGGGRLAGFLPAAFRVVLQQGARVVELQRVQFDQARIGRSSHRGFRYLAFEVGQRTG